MTDNPLSLKTKKSACLSEQENERICQQDQQVKQREKKLKFHVCLLFSSGTKRETADWQSRERIERTEDRKCHSQPRRALRVDDHLSCTRTQPGQALLPEHVFILQR